MLHSAKRRPPARLGQRGEVGPDRIVLDLLPSGRAELRAASSGLSGFFGCLAARGKSVAHRRYEPGNRGWLGREALKITPDSNVLIRAAVACDDAASDGAKQAREAIALLRRAELIAVTVPALSELFWVLCRVYRRGPSDIVRAIRSLYSSAAVVCDRPSVEAGLAWLEGGGDFADGVIAAMKRETGGDTFVGFDKSALRLGRRVGLSARRPSELSGGITTRPAIIPPAPSE